METGMERTRRDLCVDSRRNWGMKRPSAHLPEKSRLMAFHTLEIEVGNAEELQKDEIRACE